ncbi:3088_t:CDS:2, partial [Acaulospora morrowiae]
SDTISAINSITADNIFEYYKRERPDSDISQLYHMVAKDLEDVLDSNFFKEDTTRVLKDIKYNWVEVGTAGRLLLVYEDCGRSYNPDRWQLEDCGRSSLEVRGLRLLGPKPLLSHSPTTWKKQRIQLYKGEAKINNQKASRNVQFQKCVTKYQGGIAKVTIAEVDKWVEEAENADEVRENKKKRKRRDAIDIKETETSQEKVITNKVDQEEETRVAVETKIKQKKIGQLFDEMRKRSIYILVKPFKSLSQEDAEDLFERITQNTVVKIDLPNFIEKYLQDLLDGDIEGVFLKVRNPPSKDSQPLLLWTSEINAIPIFSGEIINEAHKDRIYNINIDQRPTSSNRGDKNDAVIYQDQNATIIYEQSFGPTEFDETHYLEDITKLARNGVDDLNFHFIQYSNSSIMTAKNFKSISIHGYKYFISVYLTDLVRIRTYRIYEIYKCKIPTSFTERWLLKKIANLGVYLETLLTERQSIRAKMCEEDANMENNHDCISDWITIPDNTPDKRIKYQQKNNIAISW